ncbi:MAG TPA: hypothetical protein P5522_09915, partial [Spirochaetia bacterium]|nr:hypothetical protein [Spirochaetia bacterium]
DKLADELQEWYDTCKDIGIREYDKLRIIWLRNLSGSVKGLADDFFREFLSRCTRNNDVQAALRWLIVIGSILLQDYNNGALTHEDWVQIREIVNSSADTMSLDELTYIMQLVVEHGALN